MTAEGKTLNGLIDAHCVSCGLIAYPLWAATSPPPPGCPEGHDDDIARCPVVYNACVGIACKQDGWIKGPISESGQALIRRLGPQLDPILADIRAGKEPPQHKPPRPVNWHARPQ